MKNLFRLGFRFAAFASVLMAAFSTSAFAQEAAEAAVPQEQTMLDKWIIAGGWTMIPIMLVEAFIVFLVIYNMVALKKEKFCPEDLKVTLLFLFSYEDVTSYISTIIRRGLVYRISVRKTKESCQPIRIQRITCAFF